MWSVPSSGSRAAVHLGLLGLLGLGLSGHSLGATDIDNGRRIYQQGQLQGGGPLRGTWSDGSAVSGARAACASCHRPSGMGSVEGDIQVPPITGNALFGTGDKVVATMDPRSGKAFNRAHEPYSEAAIAGALRTGLRIDGERMLAPMPRYDLSSSDMQDLTAYLRQLSTSWSPGVTTDTIRFATVITPDVAPDRRAMFIDMVNKIVAQKNGSTVVAGSRKPRHHMASAAEFVLGTERKWNLDIWELQGEPRTWPQQLDDFYARQPVFALVSGLGGDEWGPVDAFCDRRAVPCWFPSVDLPPVESPVYSLYFSRGVTLEARVLAAHLRALGPKKPSRVLQIFRDDAVGRGASSGLATALASSGIAVTSVPLPAGGALALRALLQNLADDDAVMLWLRTADVPMLGQVTVPHGGIYFSGRLAGADLRAIPAAWRSSSQVVYPYELPDRRASNLAYFNAWMHQRHVPPMDEAVQSEVYFAFSYLTDTVTEMLDNVYRDYLIERAEAMLNRREGSKAEAEYYSSSQSHVRTHSQRLDGTIAAAPDSTEAPGLLALRQAGTAFHLREGTSAYPRLGLAPGQRFASKGAYIAHIGSDGTSVTDGEWLVP